MSRYPSNEYYSDGLAETTLYMLAQVHDLKVIARTSSFAFKGKAQDVRAIGRALDAAHLLEGSVQQAGNTVRITAQLVRTRDGAHLWSHKYDRQLTDVFAIQDEIAGEVVKALQLALPAAERKRLTLHGTRNLAAYQEFLRGTPLLPERNVPKMRQALQHFEKAIALDPNYAAAYAQAAITLGLLRNYSGELAPSEAERQLRYVATALRLDPGLGEAHAAQAMVHEQDKNFAAAWPSYRRAVELAPNYATALQWYAEFLMRGIGDFDQALPMFARAVAVDPLSPEVRNEYISALAAGGRSRGPALVAFAACRTI
jgi:TolB-like protein/Tfp pilus assembly protein PilF